jgi:glycine/D-amino acid oxidase-like deaminating enzyme
MKNTKYDVVIAGGGVMGCATAYYLLDEDPRLKVVIVEKDSTYAKNSTVLSDGNTRLQFNIKENIQISQYALKRLATFAEDMAVDGVKPKIAFRQEGNLFLSDEENAENAKAGLRMQQSLGCDVTWLTPDDLTSRYPFLSVDGIAGATFGALDGTMDPHAVLIAFKNKALSLGAAFIEAEVAAITHEAGRVTGVRLASGEELRSNYVVNSAGAWGTKLAKTAGIRLPIEPVMRQVFIIETEAYLGDDLPFLFFPSGIYLSQEHGNRFMCGKSFDDDPLGFDFVTNRNTFLERMWEDLVGHIPAFDRLKVSGAWAGLYAVNTFDGNAFLGEYPTLRGLMLANGFSGHGFQQCHAVGRYLSELIRGVSPSLDLSIFSPQRLLDNRPVFEGHGKLV